MAVADHLTYKNRLQEYAQKTGIPLPVYNTITSEVGVHPVHFNSTVFVDGSYFTSPNSFTSRKAAEQDVAKIAYCALTQNLTQKIKSEAVQLIGEDKMFCKATLNEYAVKMNLERPTYTTIVHNGPIPVFSSTVLFDGVNYTGDVARTKKDAEQLAARAVVSSILDSDKGLVMFKIVKSKSKLCPAINPSNSSVNPDSSITNQAGTMTADSTVTQVTADSTVTQVTADSNVTQVTAVPVPPLYQRTNLSASSGLPTNKQAASGQLACMAAASVQSTYLPAASVEPTYLPTASGPPTSLPATLGQPTSLPATLGQPTSLPATLGQATTGQPTSLSAPLGQPTNLPSSYPQICEYRNPISNSALSQGASITPPIVFVRPVVDPATLLISPSSAGKKRSKNKKKAQKKAREDDPKLPMAVAQLDQMAP